MALFYSLANCLVHLIAVKEKSQGSIINNLMNNINYKVLKLINDSSYDLLSNVICAR